MAQLQIVDSSMDRITERVELIDESKELNDALKASSASLLPEERASILEAFINNSSNVRVTEKKDGTRIISGSGMIGFNVKSIKSGKNVGIIKTFEKDANVIFQAYGKSAPIKLGKLTVEGVKRITKIEA